jgi:two-component system alkaline phosphatase synthesis response regulator PhoP
VIATPRTTRPDILLVDDNEQNLELLEAFLEDVGCTLRRATDGLEALRLIGQKVPDLILLDVMMPRMSGFQLCRRLKGDPATRHVPIVMVTALGEVSDVERAHDVGADDYLVKPVNKPDLIDRVHKWLGGGGGDAGAAGGGPGGGRPQ